MSAATGARCFHASTQSLEKDFYDTLGVSSKSSDSEIKKAYYKLAKKYHPDTNKSDATSAKRFSEIQEAYDTLKDPQKRSVYDQLGHQRFQNSDAGSASGGGFGGFGGGGGSPFGGRGGGGFDDVFQDMAREFFGGGAMGGSGGMFSSFQVSSLAGCRANRHVVTARDAIVRLSDIVLDIAASAGARGVECSLTG